MTLDVSMCRDALKKTFSNHGGVDLLKTQKVMEEVTTTFLGVFVDAADTCH